MPGGAQLVQPGGVEADLGPFRIEDLEDLCSGKSWRFPAPARASAADVWCSCPSRVADHAGEVADQEQDLMTQVLEVAQLVDQDRMPQVQVGCRRVETQP